MSDINSHSSEDRLIPITEGGQTVDVFEHGAQSSNHGNSSSASRLPHDDTGDGSSSGRSEALGRGISSLLGGIITDFDSQAVDTARSQDQVSGPLDRLTRELDQLLEDAPVPFIMQHAARISGVRKRVSTLNVVLKSVQRRINKIDRILTVGSPHGHDKSSNSKLP